MGGELVNSSSPVKSYTEQFNEHFPVYLAIGMTFDQYWNDDCTLVRHYRKADEIRKDRINAEAWLQGAYIYEAFCDVSPVLHAFAKNGTRPNPYPAKPYALNELQAKVKKEEDEKQERVAAAEGFARFAEAFNRKRRERGELNGNAGRTGN